jgi:hypothetical protein
MELKFQWSIVCDQFDRIIFKRLEHEVDEKLGIDCREKNGMPSSSTPLASFSYRI